MKIQISDHAPIGVPCFHHQVPPIWAFFGSHNSPTFWVTSFEPRWLGPLEQGVCHSPTMLLEAWQTATLIAVIAKHQ